MEESREELQQKVAQNRELMPQLTKKNDRFIVVLNKALDGCGIFGVLDVVAMNDM